VRRSDFDVQADHTVITTGHHRLSIGTITVGTRITAVGGASVPATGWNRRDPKSRSSNTRVGSLNQRRAHLNPTRRSFAFSRGIGLQQLSTLARTMPRTGVTKK